MSVRDGRPSARGHASESGVVRRRTSPRSVPFADFPFFIELKNGRMPFPSYAFGRERPFGESAGFPAGLFSRPSLSRGRRQSDRSRDIERNFAAAGLSGTSSADALFIRTTEKCSRNRSGRKDISIRIIRIRVRAKSYTSTDDCLPVGFPVVRTFDRTANTGENIRWLQSRAIEIDLYCCNTYMIFRFSVVLVFTWLRKSDFFSLKSRPPLRSP